MNRQLARLELSHRVMVAVELCARLAGTTGRRIRAVLGAAAELAVMLGGPSTSVFAVLGVVRLWAALRLVQQVSDDLHPDATAVSVKPLHSSIPNPLSEED